MIPFSVCCGMLEALEPTNAARQQVTIRISQATRCKPMSRPEHFQMHGTQPGQMQPVFDNVPGANSRHFSVQLSGANCATTSSISVSGLAQHKSAGAKTITTHLEDFAVLNLCIYKGLSRHQAKQQAKRLRVIVF